MRKQLWTWGLFVAWWWISWGERLGRSSLSRQVCPLFFGSSGKAETFLFTTDRRLRRHTWKSFPSNVMECVYNTRSSESSVWFVVWYTPRSWEILQPRILQSSHSFVITEASNLRISVIPAKWSSDWLAHKTLSIEFHTQRLVSEAVLTISVFVYVSHAVRLYHMSQILVEGNTGNDRDFEQNPFYILITIIFMGYCIMMRTSHAVLNALPSLDRCSFRQSIPSHAPHLIRTNRPCCTASSVIFFCKLHYQLWSVSCSNQIVLPAQEGFVSNFDFSSILCSQIDRNKLAVRNFERPRCLSGDPE